MNSNQIAGLSLCGVFGCYVVLDAMGVVKPEQYHLVHSTFHSELLSVVSAVSGTASSTASGASLSLNPGNLLYKLG